MYLFATSWPLLCSLALCACAAMTDVRSGLIPNWLTLPSACGALLAHAWFDGAGGLGLSLASVALCGGVPLVLFGVRAIGGGDVKLFAALGALLGVQHGLELQILSYALCAIYALCLLAYRGTLLATLGRCVALLWAPFLPAARRAALPVEAMTPIKLGGAIFAACALITVRGALGV
jgi:prepilin peptidase CpaA